MMNLIIKEQLGAKFYWQDIEMEVVAIKSIGNFKDFIDHTFSKGTFYNPKTNVVKDYKEMYQEILNSGQCVFNKNYLVFKEGYEKTYAKYVMNYVSGVNDKDELLLNSLKDKSSFGRIKSYIKMVKEGSIRKELFQTLVSSHLKNENIIEILV